MSSRRRLIVGVVSGLLAVVMLLAYASSISSEASRQRDEALRRYGGEQLEVCVATCELSVGETVSEEDVEMRSWLVDLVPQGAADNLEDVVGQQVRYPIASNEAVVTARLGASDSSFLVPDGYVAVSIPVDDEAAIGGSVEPGQRVDVYQSSSAGTVLLLEKALVLQTNVSAAAQTGSSLSQESARESLSWVTIAVSPSFVQQVVSAGRQGGMYLTLPGESASEGQEKSDEEEPVETIWPTGEGEDWDEDTEQ